MAEPNKKKFLVLFLTPASVLDDWRKTDPETRRPAEEKMQTEWRHWMSEHAAMILSSESAGKTKRVSPSGVADVRNDIMLLGYVEAESHEAAAKAFEGHPHLQIPQASIEVMEVRPMGPM